ncbi:terpene utilization protein AtuA (plasmid) [Neorhizobium sp. SOG26]|uniref:acyclic terpene utilization AtuA family protein n=1 Tax=Neorhizobium sp. SOG26 TaxID=2060726 RepID=UPI000E57E53D|nr:acyclic terpene utilization AtuA family protein [Neorhizobium sp. SOG26]AXV17882.1 terpene utilization protein AtuA [Neorhizobium sp. SOG26]
MNDRIIRIGGASGAWGDSPMAIPQLLTAEVDYLMMDYLAEVTMSLLARARMKDPSSGFPPDFIAYMKPVLKDVLARGIKVVTNAGGVNPAGCCDALQAVADELGLSLRIAFVTGDDVMPLLDRIRADGVRDAHSGHELPAEMLTANAYLGALPIKAALDQGADIVISGRCADSALALGILMHEFGWAEDDYDRLSAGSLVGHVLECGPQATGGTHTDWEDVPGWENIGYPIAECREDGTFVLAKPTRTGGLIAPQVVAEQVLYEIGDPAAYMLPDVIADFSHVTITQEGPDRVHVAGARGRAPSRNYKVSATWQDGFRAVATISIVGPDAARKAERTAAALIARARAQFAARGLPDFTATHVEALGAEASYAGASQSRATREVLLRCVVQHPSRQALDLFSKETGSIGLSFSPGTTGIFGGRPKATPVVRLFTFFIGKHDMPPPVVSLDRQSRSITIPGGVEVTAAAPADGQTAPAADGPTVHVPLLRIAYARSGDKGDSSNIAIIARRPEFLPVIRREVTPEKMLTHFAGLVDGPAERFEAPGLNALNFLMQSALGGGGMASLRIDPQGKAFGQMALEMKVAVPERWVAEGLVKA